MRDVPESDWKVFREVREAALDRLCRRILLEVRQAIDEAAVTPHERYLAVWELLRTRDRQLGRAFDDPKRSRMLEQLAAIHALGLLESSEVGRFTAATRSKLEELSQLASERQ
jgi:hypothetical protein